jgi:hypothetical protein
MASQTLFVDEDKKRAILNLARALEHLLPQFSLLTKEILQNPDDPQLVAQYDKLKADLKSLSNQLALCSVNAEMDIEVQRLIEALNLKNLDVALEEGKKLVDHMADKVALAKLVASGISDVKRKNTLLHSAKLLETSSSNLLPEITAAVKKGDATSVNKLNQTIQV